MSELKKEFRWFNIMEYEKEENYLSKRHQEGWKFKRVTFPGVYTFERSSSPGAEPSAIWPSIRRCWRPTAFTTSSCL